MGAVNYNETDQVLIATKRRGIVALQTGVKMDNDIPLAIKMGKVHYY
ncbi:MAG TPA: hypothetical protein VF172_11615 [Nitrososphaera sp.]|jgi:hypothetical protein